jgi:hypothetical protein
MAKKFMSEIWVFRENLFSILKLQNDINMEALSSIHSDNKCNSNAMMMSL